MTNKEPHQDEPQRDYSELVKALYSECTHGHGICGGDCNVAEGARSIEALSSENAKLNDEVGATLNRLQAAHEENAKLQKAIGFYADEESWRDQSWEYETPDGEIHEAVAIPAEQDNGEIARTALKGDA